MSKELELYKIFIDGLVERKDSMTARWVKGDGFPKTEDNKAKNELLATLTPEQKGIIAEMLQDEHIAGIHDTLASVSYTHLDVYKRQLLPGGGLDLRVREIVCEI